MADLDAGFGAFCKVLRPSPLVDPRYFGHYFQTTSYRRSMSAAAAGANINNLRSRDLDDLQIPLPPIEEQRRIAAVLDQVDDLRAKRRASLALLDSLTESIFLDMFGGDSHAKGLQRNSLGGHLTFLTSGSRGWARYYSAGGTTFLRIQNVNRDDLDLTDTAYVDAPDNAEARRTRVRPGDVLMSITADLGRTCVVPAEADGAYINQHLCLMRTETLVPRYLSAFLTSSDAVCQIAQKNRAAVKAGLNFDDVRSIEIPVPPLVQQRKFAERAAAVDEFRRRFREAATELDALFASLQHRAFSGAL